VPSGPLGRHSVGGEGLLEGVQERRLILLDRQHVVAAGRDDLRAHRPLRQQRVGGHDAPGERHPVQELAGGGEFLALAGGPQLRQDRLRPVRVRRHQVHPRHVLAPVHVPAGAAQGLAVQRQRIVGRDPGLRQPVLERRLKRRDVERAVHAMQRRHARPPPRGKAERLQQLRLVRPPLSDPLCHRRLPARAAQHRRHRCLQQGDQRHRLVSRPPPVRPPRIGHSRQRRRQRARSCGRAARQRLAPPKHHTLPCTAGLQRYAPTLLLPPSDEKALTDVQTSDAHR
jgi:hypothetical protein